MLIFRKSPWSSRIKHKSWKNQLSMKENTDFFLGRKQNGRKETRNAFSLEKTYYVTNISSRLNFQEYIIRFFTCVLFFQMLIKYLKVSVLYEWTAVHCLLFKASGSMIFWNSWLIFLWKNSKLVMKDTKQTHSWIANYEAAFQNLSSTNRNASSEKKSLHHFEWLLLNLKTYSKNWGSLPVKKLTKTVK